MSNVIDSLVKVTISISSGSTSEESFNNILLVDWTGNLIDSGKVYDFTSADEVKEIFGNTEMYTAAGIAFTNGAMDVYAVGKTSEDETIEDILDRALDKSGWYGFAIVGDLEATEEDTTEENTEDAGSDTDGDGETEGEDEDNDYDLVMASDAVEEDASEETGVNILEQIATWADTNNKLFGFVLDFSDGVTDSYVCPVADTHNYAIGFATRLADHTASNSNKYLNIAAMAYIMTYQPGSETWAYKTFSGVSADEWPLKDITILKDAAHLNYYVTCAGKDILLDGKCMSGEWIDVIRFRDWLLNDIQSRVFNLFIKNAKIPYTDAGIALIQNQIITSLKSGQSVGGIADTYYDDDGNEVAGYSVTVPTTLEAGDSNRANRILANCKFTARLAGAIHIVEITGTLTE